MKIEVHFHTVLQRRTPEGLQRCVELELLPGSTLLDLLQILELELDPEQVLMVVDSKVVDVHHILAEGERVSLIPAMSGGMGFYCPWSV
jgi:sulfur carrier protein ThiS